MDQSNFGTIEKYDNDQLFCDNILINYIHWKIYK